MSQSVNNKRRTRMDAGCFNINQKKLANYRRDQVFRLALWDIPNQRLLMFLMFHSLLSDLIFRS